ncbi:MAG: hypothetical protein GWO20_00735 [Candidatus Korarchaeota archaeon]|nr:hypothetical protein [Candidatus Korarchaeota archaeon]NIU82107.1 hypothetical protein [Candidatus Thorarchaeota archaeon]NIW12518.1 hypothetical protein [Candidatus Thorarchaeota archaeon]NIW50737.1 hypothetical protein [Candidatus Korarchaeota archaeon]
MVRKDYRSHVGVILRILEVIASQNSTGVTKIIRDANLAYNRAKTYLNRLEQRGYIERIEQGRSKPYRLTEKGREFLKVLRWAEGFFDSLGFPL